MQLGELGSQVDQSYVGEGGPCAHTPSAVMVVPSKASVQARAEAKFGGCSSGSVSVCAPICPIVGKVEFREVSV